MIGPRLGAVLAAILCAGPVHGAADQLVPTSHPPAPATLDQIWFVPRTTASGPLADAAKLVDARQFAKALNILEDPGALRGSLVGYAAQLTGLARMGLEHPETARDAFRAALAASPSPALWQAASLGEAEAEEALGDPQAALEIYDRVAAKTSFHLDAILLRMANAAVEAGDRAAANRLYTRLYFDYPLTDAGAAAAAALDEVPEDPPLASGSERYARELARGEQLFAARRYPLARTAFEKLAKVARGADRARVDLRVAETDYFTRRYRNARDLTKPYLDAGTYQSEAMFYWALAVRALGAADACERTLRRIVADAPTSSWAEDALNQLGTHFILDDEDEQADAVFRELYEKFPTGRFGERAAWKTGWWAYTHGRYADTTRIFERAAMDFPRSDNRPAWLYWLGRAYDALGDTARAQARYALAVTDYGNIYYGRLADTHLVARPAERRRVAEAAPAPVAPPPNVDVIRELLGAGLFSQAIDELRYAQAAWGDSAALQATLGWALGARGDLRAGINAMKRAYPQYMAAGGEDLPTDVLKVLFPLDYWPLIQRYSAERHLDPYLVAALVAQESTFEADVRSSANAYGLMQLLPATARRYAPRVGLRYSKGLLTSPDANLRIGTAYFADLLREFGDLHLALAGYNAGEQRVEQWKAERPALDRDAFIDDMPFPETQNYVRRILGTADDYRRLYGPASSQVEQH